MWKANIEADEKIKQKKAQMNKGSSLFFNLLHVSCPTQSVMIETYVRDHVHETRVLDVIVSTWMTANLMRNSRIPEVKIPLFLHIGEFILNYGLQTFKDRSTVNFKVVN